eukprot:CAMPEP_0177184012 /NCGR_PEP_ID=MMETSP0367-20130122/17330_1 /TAXON_ID=447022 ORGANISM="Scrippsiella hangoei-like, Strain SHHI-4" /NCGR_SAMPLE_ID=MMETSP0367 /ASSEMBLY_ACC=CAM_ASM_000362 /LENGTH=114 /DNA_ID=CAMNT_0018631099 /DNA_START=202 /DNA_END=543 /DNA_ORIENTATION=+
MAAVWGLENLNTTKRKLGPSEDALLLEPVQEHIDLDPGLGIPWRRQDFGGLVHNCVGHLLGCGLLLRTQRVGGGAPVRARGGGRGAQALRDGKQAPHTHAHLCPVARAFPALLR